MLHAKDMFIEQLLFSRTRAKRITCTALMLPAEYQDFGAVLKTALRPMSIERPGHNQHLLETVTPECLLLLSRDRWSSGAEV